MIPAPHPEYSQISLVSKYYKLLLLGIALAHSESAWENYKLRQRIAQGLDSAKPAMELVVRNAASGIPLDQGWAIVGASLKNTAVTISSETGIITITFPRESRHDIGSLKLVSYRYEKNPAPLPTRLVFAVSNGGSTAWACTSKESMIKLHNMTSGYGSMPTKYAPLECR